MGPFSHVAFPILPEHISVETSSLRCSMFTDEYSSSLRLFGGVFGIDNHEKGQGKEGKCTTVTSLWFVA